MTQNYYRLSKLNPKDDIEAYLNAFETTATMPHWSIFKWVTILGPYVWA